MINIIERYVLTLLISIVIVGCSSPSRQNPTAHSKADESKSQQVVLVKGSLSKDMVSFLIEKSDIRKGGYVVLIPTTYQAKSKSARLLQKAFYDQEVMAVHILNLLAESGKAGPDLSIKKSDILAIENAKIICILDGNDNHFMHFAQKSQLDEALLHAHKKGALITGLGKSTSLFGDFRFIVKNDTVSQKFDLFLSRGLGLLNSVVVGDMQLLNQHSKALRTKIKNKKVTFIGLNQNSAAWIGGPEAIVLNNANVAFVPFKSKGIRLGQGESFQLEQKVDGK